MAQIIFLHGASSAGKSTLALALQARLDGLFWHVSLDHLRDSGMLPMARFRLGELAWSDRRAGIFAGLHAMAGALADSGNDLILEHILDDPAMLDDLRRRLRGHDVFFVALHAPVEVLRQREGARGDRPAGSAEEDFRTIHRGRRYDLELQGTDGVERNVRTLIRAWRRGRRCSDFSE